MKKFIAVILALVLLISAAACSSTKDPKPVDPNNGQNQGQNQGGENQQGQNGEHNQGQTDPNQGGQQNQNGNNDPRQELTALTVSSEKGDGKAVVYFSRLPQNAKDMDAVDFTDEFQVAAAIIACFARYESNPDSCFEMLDVLMGPESPSAFDKSFVKEQFSQYPYVARSYVDGAAPDNDYYAKELGAEGSPDSDSSLKISYTISEGPYSRDEDGYVQLWLQSGGADSARAVKLRKKASTGEWFLFSDTYKGLLAGIRQPASSDAWN